MRMLESGVLFCEGLEKWERREDVHLFMRQINTNNNNCNNLG